jgi:hypothetical protein
MIVKRIAQIAFALGMLQFCGAPIGLQHAKAASDPAVEYGIVAGNGARVYNAGWQMHICGLRSDHWFDTFKRAMWMNLTAERQRFANMAVDRAAFERRANSLNLPGPQFPDQATCARLANSRTAEVVDHAYDLMTGGFR